MIVNISMRDHRFRCNGWSEPPEYIDPRDGHALYRALDSAKYPAETHGEITNGTFPDYKRSRLPYKDYEY